MIRISRFFLPFLCCLTAPALAGTQTRWEVVPDSTAIVWNVREGDSHRDHIEMSGLRISAVLRYGVGADGSFRFERSIVWPMLRTIPNNTHGSLMRRFVWDVPRMLSVNENCLQQEKVRRIVLDGTMTVESDWTAVKPSGRTWRCAYATDTLYAGYPHLSFAQNPDAARRFVQKCLEYRKNR